MTSRKIREVSPGSELSYGPVLKRLKVSHASPLDTLQPTSSHNPIKDSHFANNLFDNDNIVLLNLDYISNTPFKYGVVEKLFQDDLLKQVKDECLSELNFAEKETDIYKVYQTGDLASLDFLSPDELARLPGVLSLRDSLYSHTFRDFMRCVTGCGPLSGIKHDMSVNSYTRGCHLLAHDGVIDTRRISYTLHMPLPHYQLWNKDWGGALELYPTKINDDGQAESEPIPFKSILPSWNQFVFFEVQPGKSFHAIEEVIVGAKGEDRRERLSISGWFHAAQEGESGYTPEPAVDVKSSREQLALTSTMFKSYPRADVGLVPTLTLSEDHIAFLSEFLNPVYLHPRTMSTLAARFVSESSLNLHSFLTSELADTLESRLQEHDTNDGLGEDRAGLVPAHWCGASQSGTWEIKGPPHKWRYCVLKPHQDGAPREAVTPRSALSTDSILRSLQDELFASPAFRMWLAIVSRLVPTRYAIEARRFRPGLDYTLATSEQKETRLDAVLGLTPPGRNLDTKDLHNPYAINCTGWQAMEWGGWEYYMAPHNEGGDPTICHTSKSNTKKLMEGTGKSNSEDEEDEEEDSTLLAVQAGFNKLLLVLRDERVMRFVKYVSAAAEGSRWDICGEYEVGMQVPDGESESA
ncbi:hypothetical protein BDN70DRAFT_884146 [Pholiota conissans]|uniref:Fe2OG dioxygenase domain-containing protein n=1 Tax=Pholiota conissans TaxID=109636 RepID=A0A9P6CPU5_9AGAR|nr:hypothetical protein BDN70DRAFT_884146 [Pholiota conissans]